MTANDPTNRGRAVRRLGIPAAVALAVVLPAAGSALAAAAPSAPPARPSAADAAGATAVATGPATTARLAAFFAHLDARDAGRTGLVAHAEKAPGAASEAPRVTGPARAVYVLDPGFVAGRGSAPVARFAFWALRATSAHGKTASVWLDRDARSGSWHVMNMISGADETTYPGQAHGDLVFTEPQIDAWYKVHDGTVLPLNAPARDTVGAHGVTLAGYQHLVHAHYADKLPGTAYQRAGELGGFPTGHHPSAAPAPQDRTTAGATAVGGGLTAALGAAWLVRRRRRRTTAA
ncbi:hypothetical protein [Streptantibioticus cattleyicolor]|uniref:Uncharacterized protein n=1 Tax=Streptantibioticus cattleyicolor (strain ATCC 35852 / DSM 46488 / JCM 4925 / NBRC 14057 / NRRL 8057) TaxID=1003195 RepID=F8JKU6_STREN|nr:hypothetical protein [Streptantibioticus cattleyicolor]AEW99699.1 hypothetical protein SCATT_p15060 [Streptantibioticus cattleyicolor NRRL 8057 = DSM 46488]CCB71263.1 conserved exported protein of unknown function [Streptantibioticus cattleyicolor NRRL 8057 = DSM 46488]